MTRRKVHQPDATERAIVYIDGSFAPAGTGAPTAVKGKGFTVSRTSTGAYTVTLDKVYSSLLSATATLQLASLADQTIQVGAVSLTSKTIALQIHTAAAKSEVAANANNRVNFSLALKQSAV